MAAVNLTVTIQKGSDHLILYSIQFLIKISIENGLSPWAYAFILTSLCFPACTGGELVLLELLLKAIFPTIQHTHIRCQVVTKLHCPSHMRHKACIVTEDRGDGLAVCSMVCSVTEWWHNSQFSSKFHKFYKLGSIFILLLYINF